jgi:hypothetical protein
MKKFFLRVGVVSFGIFLFSAPSVTKAASIGLFSSSAQINAGDTFRITVMVNPLGSKVFTAKASVSYPADLVRVTSFTFNDAWMPLSQPGFSEINNGTGSLIKTGGYPGGLSSSIALGTITFASVKEGSVSIKVNDNSVVLDMESANTLSEKGVATLTILPARAVVTIVKKTEKPVTKTVNDVIVPDQYVSTSTPTDVPSPDKIWLYTKLALLSVLALILQHMAVTYMVLGVLVYVLFRITQRFFKK